MEKPHQPQADVAYIPQIFLKNDVLRESSGAWHQAKRGLLIYDTSTMPIHIKGNYFFDFPATSDNDPVSFEDIMLEISVFLVDITEYWNWIGKYREFKSHGF